MTAQSLVTLVTVGGGLLAVVWLLHKAGRGLTSLLEALATLAMVLVGLWLLSKAVYAVIKAAVTHWRTTLGGIALGAWLWWWWGSLPVTLAVTAVVVGLSVWRWRHPVMFEAWVGRRLMHAIAERIRWRAEYDRALLAAAGPPPTDLSATQQQAA
jgi:S-DNA-T family DNA segregation ATPase FtsK/SpoIIIE